MYVRETLSAGVGVNYTEESDFFRLLGAPTDDITVIFYKAGREEARAENIGAGYAETVPGGFDRVRITSTGGGVVKFVTRKGSEVRYDTPPNGLVTVTNNNGAMSRLSASVGSGAVTTLAAANAARRYVLVQNNDAAIYLRLRVDGTDPTTAAGLRIPPGGAWESPAGFAPTGDIKVIAESGTVATEGLEG